MAQNFEQDGNVLDAVESALFDLRGAGLIQSGDPVMLGTIPGVAELTAALATDLLSVTIVGVFNLDVTGRDAVPGDAAVALYNSLFLDTTDNQLNVDTGFNLFGYALGTVAAGATTKIPVLIARV